LLDSPNPFALLSVAHLAALEAGPETRERLAWKLRLVRGLYRQGLDGERVRSLLGLVDWVLNLTPGLDDEFCREIEEIERSKGMGYITSFERRGIEKGLPEPGRLLGGPGPRNGPRLKDLPGFPARLPGRRPPLPRRSPLPQIFSGPPAACALTVLDRH